MLQLTFPQVTVSDDVACWHWQIPRGANSSSSSRQAASKALSASGTLNVLLKYLPTNSGRTASLKNSEISSTVVEMKS